MQNLEMNARSHQRYSMAGSAEAEDSTSVSLPSAIEAKLLINQKEVDLLSFVLSKFERKEIDFDVVDGTRHSKAICTKIIVLNGKVHNLMTFDISQPEERLDNLTRIELISHKVIPSLQPYQEIWRVGKLICVLYETLPSLETLFFNRKRRDLNFFYIDRYCTQLKSAISYLHQKSFTHGFINLQTVLISDKSSSVKLSTPIRLQQHDSFILLNQSTSQKIYKREAAKMYDWFSFCKVLYACVENTPNLTLEEQFERVKQKKGRWASEYFTYGNGKQMYDLMIETLGAKFL